ncbi:MAG: hypothetical protein HYW48_07150 [Deltaproteobacteria bacterium]|nr:hypothetical protein [Deltaproteobacteria bacterium]
MNLSRFMKESGFKVLAMAKLSSCEYSAVLHLMNCSVSGMDEIITTYSELASLIGYEEDELEEALLSLAERFIIKLKEGELHDADSPASISLGIEFDFHKWNLKAQEDLTPQDAIVYPFLRNKKGPVTLHEVGSLTGEKKQEAWEKILSEYVKQRSLNAKELAKEEASARTLAETHPLDHIMLMLDHFRKRIRNLSLLASSWQHYQELYESETHKVDFMQARKKHQLLDEQLKKSAREWLADFAKHSLGQEEIAVLKMIIKHQHPRRQLYWAYQARDRFSKLTPFFKQNADFMLSVTTTGAIVRKNKPLDD